MKGAEMPPRCPLPLVGQRCVSRTRRSGRVRRLFARAHCAAGNERRVMRKNGKGKIAVGGTRMKAPLQGPGRRT
jgi:hypothetical protein